jgi:hypothetical protein
VVREVRPGNRRTMDARLRQPELLCSSGSARSTGASSVTASGSRSPVQTLPLSERCCGPSWRAWARLKMCRGRPERPPRQTGRQRAPRGQYSRVGRPRQPDHGAGRFGAPSTSRWPRALLR